MRSESSAPKDRLARARRYGFTATGPPAQRYWAKPGSHDDGPQHGLFLGGLGGPVFSRDLDGRFVRWHLEPGAHVLADVEQCQLVVHWRDDRGEHARVLRRSAVSDYEVAGLFPYWHEVFGDEEMPFRVVLTGFSPLIPGDEDAAGLPIACFEVHVIARDAAGPLPEVDVALFWANLNGWRASRVTAVDRGDRAWPGHHHAGNQNWAAELPGNGTCVVQGRLGDMHGPSSTVGEVCVSVRGDTDVYSRHVQFKTDQNATGVPDHKQVHTFAAVRFAFDTTGRLDTTPDGTWSAHWHEPVGSAVAAHHAPGKSSARTRFVVAFDWPHVVFGQGRAWRRRYDETWPVAAGRAVSISAHAQSKMDSWLKRLDTWHEQQVGELCRAGWAERIAGCVINETGLLTSLGTIWVHGNPPGYEPCGPLGSREHFGLLEGFDTGYFYVNTSDLWHYAFPALSRTWPRLADLVFSDLSEALAADADQQRPIYRPGQQRKVLVADRLPHDMGAVQEDPFARLNGYSMRDDPNTWRDANPAFTLATIVHHRIRGRSISESAWARLRAAAEVVTADADSSGVPRHDEFGDSTWDNLGLRGWSSYASGLYAGMWAALDAEGRRRGTVVPEHSRRLAVASEVLDSLWTGEHYRACSEGKYVNAVMPDSLLGVFYAEMSGARPVVPRKRIVRHLQSAFAIAFSGFRGGGFGPLLIAEPGTPRYSQDGGQELQVNEVLLGTGWMFTAMLRWYGLDTEATAVATSMRDVLYAGTGLQYRTPAAVDGAGRFRAPLNMRPLSIWWLDTVGAAFRCGDR